MSEDWIGEDVDLYTRVMNYFYKHKGAWLFRDEIATALGISRTHVYEIILQAKRNGFVFQEGKLKSEGTGKPKKMWRLA